MFKGSHVSKFNVCWRLFFFSKDRFHNYSYFVDTILVYFSNIYPFFFLLIHLDVYYEQGFLGMQTLIDKTFISMHDNSSENEFEIQVSIILVVFPQPITRINERKYIFFKKENMFCIYYLIVMTLFC